LAEAGLRCTPGNAMLNTTDEILEEIEETSLSKHIFSIAKQQPYTL
jgi:hypothetical protein